MHGSSLRNMQACVAQYVTEAFLARGIATVVDVGALDVNGSYRPLFADRTRFNYLGVDSQAGPNVDLVLTDPYRIPLHDGSADLVISGQMLEHCEFFWSAFTEMVRVLAPDGYLFLIAPSAGPVHRYPVDCWRFYPDAYRALAKWAKCECVAVWIDETDIWRDAVGVFRHRLAGPAPAAAA